MNNTAQQNLSHMTSDVVHNAKLIAMAAHEACGQTRRFADNEVYWMHCFRVASTVAEYGGSDEQVAAAWLHDTLEDTQVSKTLIETMCGTTVLDLVVGLTDKYTKSAYPDLNRAERFTLELAHKRKNLPEGAVLVKLADILDNTRGIADSDPKFAEVYLAEKSEQISLLSELIDRFNFYVPNTDTFMYESVCNLWADVKEQLLHEIRVLNNT